MIRVGPAGDASRYVLHDLVGVGGGGRVYRGTVSSDHSRLVAIKVLHVTEARDIESAHERYDERRRLLVDLAVPRLGVIVDVFVGRPPDDRDAPDALFVVMPWYDGVDLRRWRADQSRNVAEGRILELLPLAETLDILHAAGCVHGDVTPTNVVVRDGASGIELVLVDPDGLASADDEDDDAVGGGTRGYRAPEVVLGEPPSIATDNFGFAATVCFSVTGDAPPQHIDGTPDLEALRGRLLMATSQIELTDRLLEMLDGDPDRRPTECVRWLGEALSTITTTSGPLRVTGPRHPAHRRERLTRWAVGVAVTFAVLVAAIAVAVAATRGPTPVSGDIVEGPAIAAPTKFSTLHGVVHGVGSDSVPWLVWTPIASRWWPTSEVFPHTDGSWTAVARGPGRGGIVRLELMLVPRATSDEWNRQFAQERVTVETGGVAPIEHVTIDDVLVDGGVALGPPRATR